MKRFYVSEEDGKAARWPHELFLINLVFNHIFLFVSFLSASSLQRLVIIVPIVSFTIIAYSLWRARVSLKTDPWFTKCHWQLAHSRSKIFLIMLAIMAGAMGVVYLVSGGHMRPQHWALFGAGILPTMVTVLVLILMESEALHLARSGLVPDWLVERFNADAPQPLAD